MIYDSQLVIGEVGIKGIVSVLVNAIKLVKCKYKRQNSKFSLFINGTDTCKHDDTTFLNRFAKTEIVAK